MVAISRILFLISLQCYIGHSIIPILKVNKLDRKLVASKRQDTLDMCRIFTAENEKLSCNETTFNVITNPYSETKLKSRRAKRSLENKHDVRRVKRIGDQLYDDVLKNGKKDTYRRKNLDKNITQPSAPENLRNIIGRKYNFAPAELIGPECKMHKKNDNQSDVISWHKKWKHGIVPFFIDYKTYDSHLAEIITEAFDYFENATCIRLQRLRERPTDKQSLQGVEWLYITNPSGIRQCVHSNHRKTNSGVQTVVFGYDCLSLGEIVHEVMHILGFAHEHTRPDRDQHITILWDNIKPGYRKYFEIRPDEAFTHTQYDLASVLHYPSKAFSKNGRQTILEKSGVKLGQRDGLSSSDIQKIEIVYGNECAQRNKQYLLKTCPSVVKSAKIEENNVTQEEIVDYFKNRLWTYGVVNYKLKDAMEFSAEERENIKAVIRHIEKETCIEFRELTEIEGKESDDDHQNSSDSINKINSKEIHPPKISNVSENKIKTKQIDENCTNEITKPTELESPEHSEQDGLNLPSINITQNAEGQYLYASIILSLHLMPSEVTMTNEPTKQPTVTVNSKRVRRAATLVSRRHSDSNSALILMWTQKSGCTCPEPGRPSEKRELEISSDCFNSVNDLLHLFVHVLGLDHQHNMHDRDSYLHIRWENLTEAVKKEMLNKLPPAASVGFPYDYRSVMHYPWLEIKDGVTNIMYPIWNDGWAMGHWQGLSSTDVQKINLLYYEQCTKRNEQANLGRI